MPDVLHTYDSWLRKDGVVADILRFDEDSDDIGLLLATEPGVPDDGLFWRTVTRDAQEYEWEYGTEEHPELCDESGHTYVAEKVAAWVLTQVQPPQWRWYRFVDEEPVEYADGTTEPSERAVLQVCDEGDDDAMFGAVIALVRAGA